MYSFIYCKLPYRFIKKGAPYGSHSFTQCNISVAAANDRCDNPRDRNLADFEESEKFQQFIGFTIQLFVG